MYKYMHFIGKDKKESGEISPPYFCQPTRASTLFRWADCEALTLLNRPLPKG